MLDRILPQRIDNTFRGLRLSVWLFAPILLMRSAQCVAVLFGGAAVIREADGIPLDEYSTPAAQTIVSVLALLGFTRLLICVIGLVVLVRYRSVLPAMFALFAFHDLGRYLIFQYLPIERVGAPPAPFVNSILTVLTAVGLVLSLVPRRDVRVTS